MWPYNQGLWSWGSEIVVHFTRKQWLGKNIISGHEIKPDTPGSTMQARSIDNGDTWTIEGEFKPTGPAKKPNNFTNPGFAMKAVGGNLFADPSSPQGDVPFTML
jgi:hypothetical protein